MLLGVHVSASGRIYEAIDRACALQCTAMQLFSRNPRQWKPLSIPDEDVREFRRRRQENKIGAVIVHIPYLINLATPDAALYQKSVKAYVEDVKQADALGADLMVTHMGSATDGDTEKGLARLAEALNSIFSRTQGTRIRLLLENTAGSGHSLGACVEHLQHVFQMVEDRRRLGACLDTAHAWAAGFDIRNSSTFDALLEDMEHRLGKGSLKVIHLNDSKSDLGSRSDRHENIGEGKLGTSAIEYIVNHPRLKKTAFILETPKETEQADRENLERVRRMIKNR